MLETFFITKPNGAKLELYTSPDKPRYKQLLEQRHKVLQRIVTESLPEATITGNRQRGTVSECGWDAVAMLSFNWETQETDVEWFHVEHVQFDRNKAEALFRDAIDETERRQASG